MILALLLGLLSASNATTAWRANALAAAERLQATTDACEKALHTAYVLHLTKPELVQKQNQKAEFMHVVLTAEKQEAFDLIYVYDKSKDELVGARITALPKQWIVAFAEANHILVSDTNGCAYDLDTKQPFKANAFKQTR